MKRALELAVKASGYAAPNPMVGSVLVYEDRIIGEGYHQLYGEAHAEVNCIASVSQEDRGFIEKSTIYVTLEPCAHFGKTPPCADLIIRNRIPKVVIGVRDPFPAVDGKGIDKLEAAGIEVITGVLETECRELNKRFFLFHREKRPYIILKWAQTANGKIGVTSKRLLITHPFANRIVHKWRTEEMGIMVGKNTAAADDPFLTVRNWKGKQPVRIVTDSDRSLPRTLKLFDGSVPTLVLNNVRDEDTANVEFIKAGNGLSGMLDALYARKIQSILVEGGVRLLQSFIDAGIWDELRILTNTSLSIEQGIAAPELKDATHQCEELYGADKINYYTRK